MADMTLSVRYRAKDIAEGQLFKAVSAYLEKLETGERKVAALTFDVGATIEAHAFSRKVGYANPQVL